MWNFSVLFFTMFFILAIAAANDITDRSVTFMAVLGLLFLCIGNPWYSMRVNAAYKKSFNKGMTDYWIEIRKIILDTSNNQEFTHNLNLPNEYIPESKTELPELKMALFDISATELESGFGEQYSIANGKERPAHMTIIYATEREVILGTPLKDLDQTIAWINENPQLITKQAFRPKTPVETTTTKYGQIKTR